MAQEKITLPGWFKDAKGAPCPAGEKAGKGTGFIEKNLSAFTSAMLELIASERCAGRPGLLQKINPGARIIGMIFIMLAAVAADKAAILAAIGGLTLILALLSLVGVGMIMKRILPAMIFTALIASPVIFGFNKERGVIITEDGVLTAAFFTLRAGVTAMSAVLLLLTTKQADFFRGLRLLPVPRLFVTALFMTFRHIFILLRLAEDTTLAKKARIIKGVDLKDAHEWFASRAALFLQRAMRIAEEVGLAMASRGFDGRLRTFSAGKLRGADYAWIGAASFVLFMAVSLRL